jgi:hypothetical protein
MKIFATEVSVAEYVRITSITSNVEVDYRFAKSEFITAKKLLEDMAGLHFTNKLKIKL